MPPTKVQLEAESFDIEQDGRGSSENTGTEAEDDGSGYKITGVALPFGEVSRNGVKYDKESVKDTADQLVGRTMLFNHNEDMPVGHITDVQVTEDALLYEGDINPDATTGSNVSVADAVERGDVNSVSIQAFAEPVEDDGQGKTVEITDWLEISAVTVPGFQQTTTNPEAAPIPVNEAVNSEQDDRSTTIIRTPEDVDGTSEARWDPQDAEDFSSKDVYFDAHAVWFREEPQDTDHVSFEVAREEDGQLLVNYEALNSAYELAETSDDLDPDGVSSLRATLESMRSEYFPDREELDAEDASERSDSEDTVEEPFAGFDDWEDCVSTMKSQGHDQDSAEDICGALKDRHEHLKTGSGNEENKEMADENTGSDADEQDMNNSDENPEEAEAAGDVAGEDILEFAASHFDGMDVADFTSVIDDQGGEYVGELDLNETASLVADRVDEEPGTILDAWEQFMDNDEADNDEDDMGPDEADDMDNDDDDEEEESVDLEEKVANLEERLNTVLENDTGESNQPRQPGSVSEDYGFKEEARDIIGN